MEVIGKVICNGSLFDRNILHNSFFYFRTRSDAGNPLTLSFIIGICHPLFGRRYTLYCRQVVRGPFFLRIQAGRIIIGRFTSRRCSDPCIKPEFAFVQFDDAGSPRQFTISIRTGYTSVPKYNAFVNSKVIIIMIVTRKYTHHILHINK